MGNNEVRITEDELRERIKESKKREKILINELEMADENTKFMINQQIAQEESYRQSILQIIEKNNMLRKQKKNKTEQINKNEKINNKNANSFATYDSSEKNDKYGELTEVEEEEFAKLIASNKDFNSKEFLEYFKKIANRKMIDFGRDKEGNLKYQIMIAKNKNHENMRSQIDRKNSKSKKSSVVKRLFDKALHLKNKLSNKVGSLVNQIKEKKANNQNEKMIIKEVKKIERENRIIEKEDKKNEKENKKNEKQKIEKKKTERKETKPQKQGKNDQKKFVPEDSKGNKCLYVVSDFHGMSFAMDKVAEKINQENKHVAILGDCMDRGKDGILILKEIKKMTEQGASIQYIPGNHDDMFYGLFSSILKKYKIAKEKNDIRQLKSCGKELREIASKKKKDALFQKNGQSVTMEYITENVRTLNELDEFMKVVDWLGKQKILVIYEYENKKYALGHAAFDMDVYKEGVTLEQLNNENFNKDLDDKVLACLWYRENNTMGEVLNLPTKQDADFIIVGHTPQKKSEKIYGKNKTVREAVVVDGGIFSYNDKVNSNRKKMLRFDASKDLKKIIGKGKSDYKIFCSNTKIHSDKKSFVDGLKVQSNVINKINNNIKKFKSDVDTEEKKIKNR